MVLLELAMMLLMVSLESAINNSLDIACFRTICDQLVKSTPNLLPKVPITVSKFVAISWNFVCVGWVEDTYVAIIRALRKYVPTYV